VEVEIRGASVAEGLAICVRDNGHGFPFAGTYELAELERLDLGPRTLRARLAALGGTLTLDSSPSGARLLMRLPVARAVA
jgi:signal transduction histidine kinase